MPDTFGGPGSQDFSTYIQHFNSACQINGYTPAQKLLLLPARLVGAPHDIFQDILTGTPNITFQQAVDALRARLEPPQQASMHEAALRQRSKLPHETQYEYAAELRRLARRAYPGQAGPLLEAILLQTFIDGQPTAELRISLASPRPATLDEAVQKAIEVGAVHAREHTRSAAPAASAFSSAAHAQPAPVAMARQNGASRDRAA